MPQFSPYVSIIHGAENIPSCSLPRRYEPPWAPCPEQKVLLIPRSQSSSWFWGPQADLWGPVIHVPTRQQRAMLCAQQLPGIERRDAQTRVETGAPLDLSDTSSGFWTSCCTWALQRGRLSSKFVTAGSSKPVQAPYTQYRGQQCGPSSFLPNLRPPLPGSPRAAP